MDHCVRLVMLAVLVLNGFASTFILPMNPRQPKNTPKTTPQTLNQRTAHTTDQVLPRQPNKRTKQDEKAGEQYADESQSSPFSEEEESSSSELSNSPQTSQPVAQSDHLAQRNREGDQILPVREIFQLILQHLLDHMPISTRSSRLQFLLLELKEGLSLMEVMNKFEKRDLALIAEHKKFIQILGANLSALLQKPNYAALRVLNRQKLVLKAYGSLSLDINLAQLRATISKEEVIKKSGELGSAFVKELMIQTKKDFESKNIKYVSQEDQMMFRRIEGREAERLLASDPFADFGMERDCQFDHVSKFGIFCSKQEQQSVSKEGVFNYRLHRTMLLLERLGVMAPHQNLKLAKSLAIFLIKLTDHHISKMLSHAVNIAKLTSRPTSEPTCDEIAYFSSGSFDLNTSSNRHNEVTVCTLKYPSLMKAYADLRTIELIEEDRLFNNLYPEMMEKLSRGKKRLSKEEKAVTEYFLRKPNVTECIGRIKSDTEREGVRRQGNTVNRTAVQPRHVKHFLESHSFYSNHQVLWRFNVIY